jgi:hypothetical protein
MNKLFWVVAATFHHPPEPPCSTFSSRKIENTPLPARVASGLCIWTNTTLIYLFYLMGIQRIGGQLEYFTVRWHHWHSQTSSSIF